MHEQPEDLYTHLCTSFLKCPFCFFRGCSSRGGGTSRARGTFWQHHLQKLRAPHLQPLHIRRPGRGDGQVSSPSALRPQTLEEQTFIMFKRWWWWWWWCPSWCMINLAPVRSAWKSVKCYIIKVNEQMRHDVCVCLLWFCFVLYKGVCV